MKRIKRNLLCLLALILMVTGVNCTGLVSTADLFGMKAHAAAKVLKAGNCGDAGSNLTFKLYSDGTLVIKGNGKMKNFRENRNDCPQTPWGTYVRQREKDDDWDDDWDEKYDVDYEYVDNTIKSVIISKGVTSVGNLAFKNCRRLTSVSFSTDVNRIIDDAFDGCYSLRTIHYSGNRSQWRSIRIDEDSREAFARVSVSYGSVGSHSHDYKTKITKKASLSSSGKEETVCSICNKKQSKTIAKIASIKLSSTVYKYNGKVRTPSVVVKDSKGKKLVKGEDYSVSYSKGRKKVGKYSVKVTFKGEYTGSKYLSFKIVKK